MPKIVKKQDKDTIVYMKQEGYSNKEISEKLRISEETVAKYVKPKINNKNLVNDNKLQLNLSENSKAKIMAIAIKTKRSPNEAVDKMAEYYLEGIHDENIEVLENTTNKVDELEEELQFLREECLKFSQLSNWECDSCGEKKLMVPIKCLNCTGYVGAFWGNRE